METVFVVWVRHHEGQLKMNVLAMQIAATVFAVISIALATRHVVAAPSIVGNVCLIAVVPFTILRTLVVRTQ